MSNLHPLEYGESDKVSVSAAVGGYKDSNALAAGVFYRPNAKTLISMSGTLGDNDNMYGIGFSQKLGKVSEIEKLSDEEVREKLVDITKANAKLAADNQDLAAKNEVLSKSYLELKEKVDWLMSHSNIAAPSDSK